MSQTRAVGRISLDTTSASPSSLYGKSLTRTFALSLNSGNRFGKSVHGALKNSPVGIQWVAAANYAIDATEAVCVAENLYARDLGERISASIESTLPSTEELVREKISLQAKRAAIKKHSVNYAARARVIELYQSRRYASVEAASQSIAPLVHKAPRTVSKWLYDERKGRTPQLPHVTD